MTEFDPHVIFDTADGTVLIVETALGPRGLTGPAGRIVDIEVSTLPYGSTATVDNEGTETEAIIVLGVPQGAPGTDGHTGPVGPDRSAELYQALAQFPDPMFVVGAPNHTWPDLYDVATVVWPNGETGTFTSSGIDSQGRSLGWVVTCQMNVLVTYTITITYGATVQRSCTVDPAPETVEGLTSSGAVAAANAYTDAMVAAVASTIGDWKLSARVASTGNLIPFGTQTIDGISVVAGDRVLVKNQTASPQNGLYVCAAGVWPRSADADSSTEVTAGLIVAIEQGTDNAGKVFQLTTPNPIVLGTTALTFTKVDAGDVQKLNNGSDFASPLSVPANIGAAALAQGGADYPSPATFRFNLSVPVLAYAKAASITNITSLSGIITVDGVNLAAGDRVLLAGQTAREQNGPWTVASGAWTRPLDFPSTGQVGPREQIVWGGNFNGGLWMMQTVGLVTIDTTAQTWVNLSNPLWVENAQVDTVYTFVIADAGVGKYVSLTNVSPIALSIPQNITTPYPIGTELRAVQAGNGQVTWGGVGITYINTPGLKMRANGSWVTAIKRASDTWWLSGDLSA